MPLARLAVQEELHRRDNISGCDSSFFISAGNEPNRHACMYIWRLPREWNALRVFHITRKGMKKPNEKKRIFQQHQDPDRLPAPPGRLFPEGTLPEADGAGPHPLGRRNCRDIPVPEVREAGKEMQSLFCLLKTGWQNSKSPCGKNSRAST